MKSSQIITFLTALTILILDQAAKYPLRESLVFGESIAVIPYFFNLTYVRNTGAVWGCFQNQNELLVIVSFIVLILIGLFYKHLADGRRLYSWAIGLIMGGISGNLIDRIKLGWVTDFLDFYIGNKHWPAFNIADSAICIGVGGYLLASLFAYFVSREA